MKVCYTGLSSSDTEALTHFSLSLGAARLRIIGGSDKWVISMNRLVNRIGKRYGRLEVLKRAKKNKDNHACWICRCDCGTITIVSSALLANGHTRSCGCLLIEVRKTRTESESERRKKSISKLNEKNPQWKGEKVGYAGIHDWVKRRLKRPTTCQDCGKKCKPDLANISQKYKRDLTDWEWLCRRCHMEKDGRLERMKMGLKS